MKPYILKMRPYLRPKVWGGRKLSTVFGKELPADGPFGEAWEVSDLPEGQSTIVNGPLAGKSLLDACNLWGEVLTAGSADERFPLLVKVLDAQDDLSVQVHPGEDDIARLGLDADSKDECWLILDADDDGCILHGFDGATTPADFRMAVEENRAADVLRRVNVQAGDIIRVTPGTIHAICKGVCLLEIQQPSDTTYRVYDYNRPGMDGNPRELHLEDAMRVSNFDAHPPAKLDSRTSRANDAVDVLVDAEAYRIERVRPTMSMRWNVSDSGPQVVFAARGNVRLVADGVEVDLAFGETALLPAGLGGVSLDTDGGPCEVIVSGLGGEPLIAE
ncbi:MAG: type I phosphomannose isomerase catalytic subunit [Persicimonas sp.]